MRYIEHAGVTPIGMLLAGVAALALAACGGTPPTPGASNGTADAPAIITGQPTGWNTMDACATVGTDAVAAATGAKVTGTELGPKKEPEEGLASFSMCTFALDNGKKLTVLTREAKGGNTPEAIAEARKPGLDSSSPGIDVPGIGRAAVWTDRPAAFHVFIGDDLYATISLFGGNGVPDGSPAAREAATKLARKLAG